MNPDLIRQRMMRGALTGPAESEKTPLKYCQGKLDNGRPCRIVVIDGDYCRRHKKEIEALEAGAPLPPRRMERPASEETMAKKGTCKVCHKADTHIVGAGMCYHCKKAAIEAGTYPEPANIVPAKTVTSDNMEAMRDDDQQAGAGHEEDTAAAEIAAPQSAVQSTTDAVGVAELQIPPVTVAPPQEQADTCLQLSSPLAAVLVELEPPPPPLPETAIVVNFSSDMYDTLLAAGVGTVTIIELLHALFVSKEYALVRRAAA